MDFAPFLLSANWDANAKQMAFAHVMLIKTGELAMGGTCGHVKYIV